MTRRLRSEPLSKLDELTRMRELLARGELAHRTLAVEQIEAEISALENRVFDCAALADANMAAKWQVWKRQEIKRLLGVKAMRAAAKRDAALACQRMTAENQIVLHLKAKASKQEKRQRLRRGAYIS